MFDWDQYFKFKDDSHAKYHWKENFYLIQKPKVEWNKWAKELKKELKKRGIENHELVFHGKYDYAHHKIDNLDLEGYYFPCSIRFAELQDIEFIKLRNIKINKGHNIYFNNFKVKDFIEVSFDKKTEVNIINFATVPFKTSLDNNSSVILNNIEANEFEINYNSASEIDGEVILENVKVNSLFTIKGPDFKRGIIIKDSIVQCDVKIWDTSRFNSKNSKFSLLNTKFSKHLVLNNLNNGWFDPKVTIENCEFEEHLNISNLTSTKPFKIDNCTLNKDLILSGNTYNSDFELLNNWVVHHCSFYDSFLGTKEGVSKIKFYRNGLIGKVDFRNTTFNQSLKIEEGFFGRENEKDSYVDFFGSTFNQSVEFKKVTFNSPVYLSNITTKNEVENDGEELEGALNTKVFELNECTFNDFLHNRKYIKDKRDKKTEFIYKYSLKGCLFFKDFEVYECFKNEFKIDSCVFKGTFISSSIKFNSYFNISKTIFNSVVDFRKSYFGFNTPSKLPNGFLFDEVKFKEKTRFEESKFFTRVDFHGCEFAYTSFSLSTFEMGLTFFPAETSTVPLFKTCIFNNTVDINSVVIGNETDGSKYRFQLSFAKAKFFGNFYLTECSLHNVQLDFDQIEARNSRAQFCIRKIQNIASLRCNNSVFESEVIFLNNEISGESSFTNSKFLDGFLSRESKFLKDVYFNGSYFKKEGVNPNSDIIYIDFSKVEFHGNTDFSNTTFSGSSNFRGTEFKSEINFSNAEFFKIPDFNYSKLQQPPDFSRIKIHYEKKVKEGNIEKYRRLKSMAIMAHNHEKEVDFFSKELKSKLFFDLEQFKGTILKDNGNITEVIWWVYRAFFAIFRKPIQTFYWLFSDFGFSIGRPLFWLLFTLILSWNIQFFQFPKNPFQKRERFSGSIFQNNNKCPNLDAPFIQKEDRRFIGNSVIYTINETIPTASFLVDSKLNTKIKSCLFSKEDTSFNRYLFSLFQKTLGLILIFLTLLGIRNRFKIK